MKKTLLLLLKKWIANKWTGIFVLSSVLLGAGYLYSSQGGGCGCLSMTTDSGHCDCSRPFSEHWLWGLPCPGSGPCECGWVGCQCGVFCWKSDIQCSSNRECMDNKDWKPPPGAKRERRGQRTNITPEEVAQMADSDNIDMEKLNAEDQWKIMSAKFKKTNKRSQSQMSKDYQKAMRQGSFLKMDAKSWKKIVAEYKVKQKFDSWTKKSENTWDSLSKKEKTDLVIDEYEKLTAEEKERLSVVTPADRQFNKWEKLANNTDKKQIRKEEGLKKQDIQRFVFDEWASLDKKNRERTKKAYKSKVDNEAWKLLEAEETPAESTDKKNREKIEAKKQKKISRAGNRTQGEARDKKNRDKINERDMKESLKEEAEKELSKKEMEQISKSTTSKKSRKKGTGKTRELRTSEKTSEKSIEKEKMEEKRRKYRGKLEEGTKLNAREQRERETLTETLSDEDRRKKHLEKASKNKKTRVSGQGEVSKQASLESLSENTIDKDKAENEWEELSDKGKGVGGKQKDWKELGQRTKDKKGKQRDWEDLSESEKEEVRIKKSWDDLSEKKERGGKKLKRWDQLSESEKEDAKKILDRQTKESKTLKTEELKKDNKPGKRQRKLTSEQKDLDRQIKTKRRDSAKQKNREKPSDLDKLERPEKKDWKQFTNKEKRDSRQKYLNIEIQAMQLKEKIGKDTFEKLEKSDLEAMKTENKKKIEQTGKRMKKKQWKKRVLEHQELTRGKVGRISKVMEKLPLQKKEQLVYETYRKTRRSDRENLKDAFIKMIGDKAWREQEKKFNQENLNKSWQEIFVEARQEMKKDFILGKESQHISDDEWPHFQDWQKKKAVKDYYQRLDENARSQLSEQYRIRMVMEEIKGLSDVERAKMSQIEENRKLHKRWKKMNPQRKAQLDKDQQEQVQLQEWLELKSASENLEQYEQLQQQKKSLQDRIGEVNLENVKKDAKKWLTYKLDSAEKGIAPVKGDMNQMNHAFKKILRDKNWARMAHSGDKYYNYRMGLVAMAQKKYEEAVLCFQKEIKGGGTDRRFSAPNGLAEIDYFPYREMGVAHYYLSHYKEATKALEKSLKYQKSGRGEYYLMKIREDEQGIECIAARKPKLSYRLEEKDSGTRYIIGRVRSEFYLSSFSINHIKIPVGDTGTKMSFEIPVDDYDDSNSIIIEAVNLCGMANQVEIPVSRDENSPPSILKQKSADPTKNLKIMIPYHKSRYQKTNISNYFIQHLAGSLAENGRFRVEVIDPIAEGFSVKEMTKFSKLCTLAQGVEADLLLILIFNIEDDSMEVIARFLDSLTHHQVALEEIYYEGIREEMLPVMARKLSQKILRDFPSVEGHIIKSQKGMVAIDLGKNQGITMGRKFLVYKKKTLEYIGELTINKLYPDISGGKTALISPVVWVDKGDLVIAK